MALDCYIRGGPESGLESETKRKYTVMMENCPTRWFSIIFLKLEGVFYEFLNIEHTVNLWHHSKIDYLVNFCEVTG